MVLIDAAKGCATKPPDLSKYPADFVVISFYKVDFCREFHFIQHGHKSFLPLCIGVSSSHCLCLAIWLSDRTWRPHCSKW